LVAADLPGRTCPLSYRYGEGALAREATLEAETLWVAGGIYGNRFALEALIRGYEREPGEKALVFNGDFHWFDVDPGDYAAIGDGVLRFVAMRGNIETELALPQDGAGCGCAYPKWVDGTTVERSNRIMERLRVTARRFPEHLSRLAALPMYLVAQVGGERVAVVHGDAESLAGWGFSAEVLATRQGRAHARGAFTRSGIRVFASSHTCMPVLRRFRSGRAVVNNGAAGLPNFRGTAFGLATRISVRPGREPLSSARAGRLYVEAHAVRYDSESWRRRFLEQWPAGSDAHRSYYARLLGELSQQTPGRRRGARLPRRADPTLRSA
jgi:hypothetical protein